MSFPRPLYPKIHTSSCLLTLTRACRFIGTAMGLPVTCTLLWWYWPEAHGFVFHPVSIIIMGTTFVCDLAYPFLLAHVRKTEVVFPNGMIVAGDAAGTDAAAEKKTQ